MQLPDDGHGEGAQHDVCEDIAGCEQLLSSLCLDQAEGGVALQLTNVPVRHGQKDIEVVASLVEWVHPLELPPARVRLAVYEQPDQGLDCV